MRSLRIRIPTTNMASVNVGINGFPGFVDRLSPTGTLVDSGYVNWTIKKSALSA